MNDKLERLVRCFNCEFAGKPKGERRWHCGENIPEDAPEGYGDEDFTFQTTGTIEKV